MSPDLATSTLVQLIMRPGLVSRSREIVSVMFVITFLEPIQHFNFVTKPKQALFETISGRLGDACLFSQLHEREQRVIDRRGNPKLCPSTGNVAVQRINLCRPATI